MAERRYKVESSGNGACYTITRLSDGAAVSLQGDDAVELAAALERTHDGYTDDDVCSEYDDVMGGDHATT